MTLSAILGDPIQSPEQDIFIQMFRSDTWAEQLFGGEITEKTGEDVEAVFIEAKAVDEHGIDHIGMGGSMISGLGKCFTPVTSPK